MKNVKSKPAAYFDVPSMNVQATASQFKQFRTEVADAIREKTGSTDAINPKDFAEQIKNLSGSSTSLGYKYFDIRENPHISSDILHVIVTVNEIPGTCIQVLLKKEDSNDKAIVDLGAFFMGTGSGMSIPGNAALAISSTILFSNPNGADGGIYKIDLYDFLTFFETMNGSEDLSYIDFLKSHEITEAEFLEGTVEGLPQMPA